MFLLKRRQHTETTRATNLCPYPTLSGSTSRPAPAARHDRRPRPPELMLITDWPIIAQPAMPPNRPAKMFAAPWPALSRRRLVGVSEIGRASCRERVCQYV